MELKRLLLSFGEEEVHVLLVHVHLCLRRVRAFKLAQARLLEIRAYLRLREAALVRHDVAELFEQLPLARCARLSDTRTRIERWMHARHSQRHPLTTSTQLLSQHST